MDFSQLTNDPNKLGILSLGLRLMSTPGRLGSALGQAGMGAIGDMQAAQMQAERRKQQALQEQMTRLQLQEVLDRQARAKTMANAARAAFVPGTPGMMDTEAGGDGINMPAQAARFDPKLYMASLAENGAADEAMQFFMSQQKQRKPLVLAEGGKAFDEETGAVIASNPKAVAPEKEHETIRLLGRIYGEDTPAFFDALKRLGQKMTSHPEPTKLQVGGMFEKEQEKTIGKQFAETYGALNAAAFNAPGQLRKLERMEALLADVDGGRLAPMGREIASIANSFGIKIDPQLGNKEAAESLSREMALQLREPGTGPMTDKDFANFLEIVPSLSKTAEGRRQIANTMRAKLARDIKLAEMARAYRQRKGVIDEGFFDEAARFMAENPVVNLPAGYNVRRK